MRFFFLIGFFVGFCLYAVSGRAGTQDLRPIPIVTENYPPYEMHEPVNGQRGFDYEVLQEAFTRMGYRAEIQFLPWRRALNYARRGDVAGILTCAYRADREEFLNFSDPISQFTSGFYTRVDHQGIKPMLLTDVLGQKTGSVGGYESLAELKDIGADPMAAPDTASGIRMLKAGRFDYLYLGRETTDFLIREMNMEKAFRFYPIKEAPFYMCFSRNYRGTEKLVPLFNQALAAMRKDGTYRAIHAQYR